MSTIYWTTKHSMIAPNLPEQGGYTAGLVGSVRSAGPGWACLAGVLQAVGMR